MSSDSAQLKIQQHSYSFPLTQGTEGEMGIDISDLRNKTGVVTLDEGYANTGICSSKITFLDGEKGILRYRGYPIEELAYQSDFLEVAYLLIYGELPNANENEAFRKNITFHTLLHENIRPILKAFPKGAHPMGMLSCVLNALSAFYPEFSSQDEASVKLAVWRLLGKMPTIAAWAYRKTTGEPLIYPSNQEGYCENFLQMLFASPTAPYEINPDWVRVLNTLFILHADHEQNCSTATVRMVGSTQASLFASIASGISALWGPLHGGADQAVMEMFENIHNEGKSVKDLIEEAKSPDSEFRLMGFGHRVYKNFDPRAQIIKDLCHNFLESIGDHDPLLDIALKLEEAVLKDDYFKERKLYPNIDFYTGILYKAMGFPRHMFTALFTVGRLPGWIAHWMEMQNNHTRLGRPRQIYTGHTQRAYLPLEKRA